MVYARMKYLALDVSPDLRFIPPANNMSAATHFWERLFGVEAVTYRQIPVPMKLLMKRGQPLLLHPQRPRLDYHIQYSPSALPVLRWHDTNTSSVQWVRRRRERPQVQRHHLETIGAGRVPSERLLNMLARLYHGIWVLKRAWFRCLHFCS